MCVNWVAMHSHMYLAYFQQGSITKRSWTLLELSLAILTLQWQDQMWVEHRVVLAVPLASALLSSRPQSVLNSHQYHLRGGLEVILALGTRTIGEWGVGKLVEMEEYLMPSSTVVEWHNQYYLSRSHCLPRCQIVRFTGIFCIAIIIYIHLITVIHFKQYR